MREVAVGAFDIFGDSGSVAESATKDSSDNDAAEPDDVVAWDIDVRSYETHRTVERYVNLFSGGGKQRFAERLQRGQRFQPMIRAKFRAAGIPEDMYYLALVESGFDPHAYSSAAAVGMWQFMTATAKGVGLRVDWWVDERRDPIRATDAAAKFLGILRNQFGSLYLAAAAYNGGPGRVSRGLTKFADDLEGANGDDAFFALAEKDYLRSETKNYVPQLIAAALIGKEPARYGIQLEDVAPYAYDSVRVPASTPVAAIAEASGVTIGEVRDLNPHLLRGITPPDRGSTVRVPVGKGSTFDSLFSALPDESRIAFKRVVTKNKATLAGIARDAGVTAKQVGWYNPRLSYAGKGRLRAGQIVLVPSDNVVQAAFDVPDPAVERYGSSRVGTRRTHVVKRGESLGLISKRYGVSVAALMRTNRLKKQIIFPGQVIVVSGGTARKEPSKAKASSTTSKRPAAKKPTPKRETAKR